MALRKYSSHHFGLEDLVSGGCLQLVQPVQSEKLAADHSISLSLPPTTLFVDVPLEDPPIYSGSDVVFAET